MLVVLGLNYLLHQGTQAHGGDGGLDVVQYVLLHHAVGRPGLVHLGKGAVVPHCVPVDVQQLQSPGIERPYVEAGAQDQDGVLRTHLVQLPAGGKTPLAGELLLVPPLAQKPAAGAGLQPGQPPAQALLHLRQRGTAEEVDGQLCFDIVDEVQVGVIEAGHYKAALEVQSLPGSPGKAAGEVLGVRPAAHIGEVCAVHHGGLRHWAGRVHGGDGSIGQQQHGVSPLRI